MSIEVLEPTDLLVDLSKEPDIWAPNVTFLLCNSGQTKSIFDTIPFQETLVRVMSEQAAWRLRANFLEQIYKIHGDPAQDTLENAILHARSRHMKYVAIVDSRFQLVEQYKV